MRDRLTDATSLTLPSPGLSESLFPNIIGARCTPTRITVEQSITINKKSKEVFHTDDLEADKCEQIYIGNSNL